jgi:hypothetical protein
MIRNISAQSHIHSCVGIIACIFDDNGVPAIPTTKVVKVMGKSGQREGVLIATVIFLGEESYAERHGDVHGCGVWRDRSCFDVLLPGDEGRQ